MTSSVVGTAVLDEQGDDRWMSMHNRFINLTKEKEPEVLFIGDSLIERLVHTDIWKNFLVPLHCLNFGIGGDQTHNLLWRLENGELENISPKLVVVCIGTNNHQHSVEEVSMGILKIIEVIREKQPQTQVIVMGIPPRGEYPNKLRDKIEQINSTLAEKIPEYSNAQYFHVEPQLFINQDGKISHLDMHDYLHFTHKGYDKLMEPLLDEIESRLKNFMTADTQSACSTGDS